MGGRAGEALSADAPSWGDSYDGVPVHQYGQPVFQKGAGGKGKGSSRARRGGERGASAADDSGYEGGVGEGEYASYRGKTGAYGAAADFHYAHSACASAAYAEAQFHAEAAEAAQSGLFLGGLGGGRGGGAPTRRADGGGGLSPGGGGGGETRGLRSLFTPEQEASLGLPRQAAASAGAPASPPKRGPTLELDGYSLSTTPSGLSVLVPTGTRKVTMEAPPGLVPKEAPSS